ncbi:hypothetical protein KIW84_074881 [Lathyrus oleraceus]|uniref:Protein TIFY n=1 Tax=Pisum sativum TaxID=3888 RepID=A0A9D4VTG3_PEA|nr:hypothetical protein KIW84_074881 [Pisum sativum]
MCCTGAHIKASLPWDSSISEYFCFEYWFENPTPQDITTAHLMPAFVYSDTVAPNSTKRVTAFAISFLSPTSSVSSASMLNTTFPAYKVELWCFVLESNRLQHITNSITAMVDLLLLCMLIRHESFAGLRFWPVGSILNISCFTAGTCVEGHGRLRMNEMFPDTNQLTIFYNGNICSYNGIPAEKMQGIMLLVAAAAKSTETKNTMKQSPVPSPIPSSPPSPVAAADNVTSPQALCFPYPSSPKNEGG